MFLALKPVKQCQSSENKQLLYTVKIKFQQFVSQILLQTNSSAQHLSINKAAAITESRRNSRRNSSVEFIHSSCSDAETEQEG